MTMANGLLLRMSKPWSLAISHSQKEEKWLEAK